MFFLCSLHDVLVREMLECCRQMMKGQEVPSEQTNPEELFQAIMAKNPSFGRYAVYVVTTRISYVLGII